MSRATHARRRPYRGRGQPHHHSKSDRANNDLGQDAHGRPREVDEPLSTAVRAASLAGKRRSTPCHSPTTRGHGVSSTRFIRTAPPGAVHPSPSQCRRTSRRSSRRRRSTGAAPAPRTWLASTSTSANPALTRPEPPEVLTIAPRPPGRPRLGSRSGPRRRRSPRTPVSSLGRYTSSSTVRLPKPPPQGRWIAHGTDSRYDKRAGQRPAHHQKRRANTLRTGVQVPPRTRQDDSIAPGRWPGALVISHRTPPWSQTWSPGRGALPRATSDGPDSVRKISPATRSMASLGTCG